MALAIWYIIFHVDFLSASKDGDVHCGYQWITEFLTVKKNGYNPLVIVYVAMENPPMFNG